MYLLHIQMADLRQRITMGQEDINVGSIERYERLVRLIIDNSANILDGEQNQPYFHASDSVRELEPDLIDDMEAKVASLEATAMARQFDKRVRILSSTASVPATVDPRHIPSPDAEDMEASGSQPVHEDDADPAPNPSSSDVDQNLSTSSDENPHNAPVVAGERIATSAEVHVDTRRDVTDEAMQPTSSSSTVAPRVPIVVVEHDENIITPSSSGGVIIDCAPSSTVVKKKSPKVKKSSAHASSHPSPNSPDSTTSPASTSVGPPPSNQFPPASIIPTENGHKRAVFNSAPNSGVAQAQISNLFGEDSDDDIPEDAVAQLTQDSKQPVNNDDEDQSQSSQMSMDSGMRFINDDGNTPVNDENDYEDISDEENSDGDKGEDGSMREVEGGVGDSQECGSERGGEGGDGNGENGGSRNEEEGQREEGGEGSGNQEDEDVDVESEMGDGETGKAVDTLMRAMQQSDLPTTSNGLPSYAQSFADDGNVQFSSGATSLRLAPKNGVITNRYPITPLVTAQAGFHDRDSYAFSMKVRQDAYTPDNPLMKDPNEKRQTTITDHLGQPIARQSHSTSIQATGTDSSSQRSSVPDSSSRRSSVPDSSSQRSSVPDSSSQRSFAPDSSSQRQSEQDLSSQRQRQQPSSMPNPRNGADSSSQRQRQQLSSASNPRNGVVSSSQRQSMQDLPSQRQSQQQSSAPNPRNGADSSSQRSSMPPPPVPNPRNGVVSSSQRQSMQNLSSQRQSQQQSSALNPRNAADSSSDANRPRAEPISPRSQSTAPAFSGNIDQSSLKRPATTTMPSEFKAPKRPNITIGSRSTGDLPAVRKDGMAKKSKTLLDNKCCKYCHQIFYGKIKALTPRQHVLTGSCDFIKCNMREIGVNKKCKHCPKQFIYHKGMYGDIIDHFTEQNHSCQCHICGESHLFSDIFSHISSEILDFFLEGVKCSRCKSEFKSALSFYHHLESVHSVKDKNVSVFSKFLIDCHPKYDHLLTALLLTHSKENN